MDGIVEENTLVSETPLNQDDEEVLTKRKLNRQADNIPNSNFFNSKKYLKQLILWIVLFICLLLLAGPLALHLSHGVRTCSENTTY